VQPRLRASASRAGFCGNANYEKSIELDPDLRCRTRPWQHPTSDSVSTNDALAQFRRAVEIEPAFVEARYNLGGVRNSPKAA